jgi:hypothetical protein
MVERKGRSADEKSEVVEQKYENNSPLNFKDRYSVLKYRQKSEHTLSTPHRGSQSDGRVPFLSYINR